jgi:preprotein translocase subunit SecG
MVVLNIIHVLIAIAMVALILVQRGAGATAGAAFGSGASGTVFGARGAGTFLTKSTWVLGALFCAISLAIAVIVSRVDVTPATDLGVIATSETAEQETEAGLAKDAAPEAQTSEQVDVPTMMINENNADGADSPSGQAVNNVSGEVPADVPENEVPAEESAEINQDQEAAGTDSDDS